jgi:hypothetical protein
MTPNIFVVEHLDGDREVINLDQVQGISQQGDAISVYFINRIEPFVISTTSVEECNKLIEILVTRMRS